MVAPAGPANPVVRRMQLANSLRRMRIRAGLTLEQAAEALEASAATVSRIETGVRVPGARDVRDLLQLYGVTEDAEAAELTGLVAGAKEAAWWESYSEVDDQYATFIGLELAATRMQQAEAVVMPGLLQSEGYTRAYLEGAISPISSQPFSPHDIDKRVEVTRNRQQAFQARMKLGQVEYDVILDEAVVRRGVGGPAVMREQIDHLLEAAADGRIDLRLIPFDAGAHPGQAAGFTVLSLPKDVSDVVYMDTVAGQLFLDDRDGLERHRRVFRSLQGVALTEDASVAALHEIKAAEFGG